MITIILLLLLFTLTKNEKKIPNTPEFLLYRLRVTETNVIFAVSPSNRTIIDTLQDLKICSNKIKINQAIMKIMLHHSSSSSLLFKMNSSLLTIVWASILSLIIFQVHQGKFSLHNYCIDR